MKTEKPEEKPKRAKPEPLPADFSPAYATPDEVAAYARISRRVVERRMRDDTYKSFLAGPNKRLVVFQSVIDDIERRIGQGAQFDRPLPPAKGARGRRGPRPKRAAEAASASAE